MQTLDDNPVTVSGLVLTAALALLAVGSYYLKLTPEEFGIWAGVLTALCALLHWWLANRVQPDSKPVDRVDGMPLVRADDNAPGEAAAKAGRTVLQGSARHAVGVGEDISPVARWSK